MMTARIPFKASLLTLSLVAALAACGGGGGDPAPAASTGTPTGTSPAPAPAPAPAPTEPAPTTPPAPTAATGTSSGSASDTQGTISIGLPPSPVVPTANQVLNSATPPTYASGTQVLEAWGSIQDWRGAARTEEEGAFGVGLLTQDPARDTIASQIAAATPNLTSADAAERQAALASATQAMTTAGFSVSAIAAAGTANTIGVTAGAFCSKALFSGLPGVELALAGMRTAGLFVPEGNGTCVLVSGLASAGTWQLPPTGSSSVYPFPGKLLTLTQYWGDFASLGFTTRPGHVVYASVASVDALPFAVPGAGSGLAILPSAITLNEFSLAVRDSGAAVAARVLVPTGVGRGTGVTAQDSTAFRFPTSMALIPEAALLPNTAYRATFRATVNGRTVTRTWEFTSADN